MSTISNKGQNGSKELLTNELQQKYYNQSGEIIEDKELIAAYEKSLIDMPVSTRNIIDASNELDENKGFHKDAIVVRYDKDGASYFTGRFTQQGEGIFESFPNKA